MRSFHNRGSPSPSCDRRAHPTGRQCVSGTRLCDRLTPGLDFLPALRDMAYRTRRLGPLEGRTGSRFCRREPCALARTLALGVRWSRSACRMTSGHGFVNACEGPVSARSAASSWGSKSHPIISASSTSRSTTQPGQSLISSAVPTIMRKRSTASFERPALTSNASTI